MAKHKKRSVITTGEKVSLAFLISSGLTLLLFSYFKNDRSAMNRFTRDVTGPVKLAVSKACAFTGVGIAEVIWAAAVIGILAFSVRSVLLVKNSRKRLRTAGGRLLAAASIALSIAAGYTVMWGANYYTDTLCDMTGLRDRGCTTQELYTLYTECIDRANELAPMMPRGEDGLYYRGKNGIFLAGPEVYRGASQIFPCLDGPERPVKPMVFSRIMSHLNFTGFYFPFTGESLVNADQPEYLIPVTVLHEICHQRNISSEEEANFIAILTGVRCDNPDYAYSACMFAYIHLGNALYRADPALQAEADARLCPEARADDRSNTAYWKQFETPAKDVGTTVYEGFLQSYGQTDGMRSYGKCVDLLAAYRFDYAPDKPLF